MPQALVYLSDHPATSDRISHLKSFIGGLHATGSNRGQAEHAAVKARLEQIYPQAATQPPPHG